MAACRSTVVLFVCGVLLLLIVPAVCAASGEGISGPPTEPSWTVEVNGPAADSSDEAVDVRMASGGVTWVCGNVQTPSGMYDISLTKIVDGVKRWTKWWDSPFHGNDWAASMALGPNRAVYITGRSSNGHHADMILLKWSSSGVLKWARRYDGPGHKSDGAQLVGVDGAGNVTISGWTNTNNQGNEWVVRSYTGGGRARWTWMHDEGPFQTQPADQCVLGNGTVYLTGNGARIIDHRLTPTAVSARLSPNGKLVWLRRYAGPNDRGAGSLAIARCPLGGVYVAGWARTTGSARDGLVLRYSAAGKRTVFALESGAVDSTTYFSDIAVTSNDRIVAVGSAWDALGNSLDGPVMVYATSGKIAARLTCLGPDAPVSFNAVAADSIGGFSVLGGTTPDESTPGHPLFAVVRGSALAGGGGWTALYGGPPDASGNAISVRGNTTVVVGTILSSTPSESFNQVVLGWAD